MVGCVFSVGSLIMKENSVGTPLSLLYLCTPPYNTSLQFSQTEYTERTKVANLLKEFVSHQKQQLKHVESKILVQPGRRATFLHRKHTELCASAHSELISSWQVSCSPPFYISDSLSNYNHINLSLRSTKASYRRYMM